MKMLLVLVFVAIVAINVEALKCYTCIDCNEVKDTEVKECRPGAHCLQKSFEKADGSTGIERRCCGRECPKDESVKSCKTCKTDLCNGDAL